MGPPSDAMSRSDVDSRTHPRWFTPLRLLAIFCYTNLFVYLDRGVIGSNGVNGSPVSEQNPEGSGIQGEFKLTYFQDGLLPAAFMVGLLLSAPVFAEACKHVSAFRLLAIGMGIWTVACIGCGIAPNFIFLLFCRALVGVGEASFVSLAAPFIDDCAPAKNKTKWFAAFYLCIPVGFALGYIVGGVVAAQLSWRWAFIFEAIFMVPFVLFVSLVQPLQLHGTKHTPTPGGSVAQTQNRLSVVLRTFWNDIKKVCAQRVWVIVDVAYTFYVAVIGVYGYWGPQAGRQLFFGTDSSSSASTADLAFGGVTVITGVVGSLGGGIILDLVGSTVRNANILCAVSSLLGCVICILAFSTTQSFAAFMVVFAFGQLAIFLLQAPVAAVGMWCVPSALRPLGISIMTVSIHLFGDVPSPPLLGLLQSALAEGKEGHEAAEQWRVSMSLVSILLAVAGLLFLAAARFSTPGTDFREIDKEDDEKKDNAKSEVLPPSEADSEDPCNDSVPLLQDTDGLGGDERSGHA
mmetsp:Transcript_6270/g.13766  ORF Transcript_6270/g.13766 Transcript_6270/m.13766 type:complete len:518 (+) Transcript_6270:206-1759(+)